ncbi:MAG TPA: hypothetical protein VFW98_15135 [Gemmatimonadaceae bacterium]|nr:hypothetical protein [Gemmatimonadaceae bacterium]
MRLVTARAPTRIDFGGGWTDVPPYPAERGGCVCNLAISRYSSVTVREAPDGITIDEAGCTCHAPTVSALRSDGRAALTKAALRRTPAEPAVLELRNDYPLGAGLGGSSAAGVALVSALACWNGVTLGREDVAERSRALELEDLRVPGGSQDHYAAAFGGALLLRFGDSASVRRIPLTPALVQAIEWQCTVVYTGQSRISGTTITAVLDAYRTREQRVTRALERLGTLAAAMADALERCALDDLGALVAEHWSYQRQLHPTISTEGIERVLSAARAAGAVGGKALGASGGGSVLIIAPAKRAAEVRAAAACVGQIVPFSVDIEGVRVTDHALMGAE